MTAHIYRDWILLNQHLHKKYAKSGSSLSELSSFHTPIIRSRMHDTRTHRIVREQKPVNNRADTEHAMKEDAQDKETDREHRIRDPTLGESKS